MASSSLSQDRPSSSHPQSQKYRQATLSLVRVERVGGGAAKAKASSSQQRPDFPGLRQPQRRVGRPSKNVLVARAPRVVDTEIGKGKRPVVDSEQTNENDEVGEINGQNSEGWVDIDDVVPNRRVRNSASIRTGLFCSKDSIRRVRNPYKREQKLESLKRLDEARAKGESRYSRCSSARNRRQASKVLGSE
jgi:hypothetical protein